MVTNRIQLCYATEFYGYAILQRLSDITSVEINAVPYICNFFAWND